MSDREKINLRPHSNDLCKYSQKQKLCFNPNQDQKTSQCTNK